MPALHVEGHGRVPAEEAQKILSLMEECHRRLRCEDLELIEISLFENDRLLRSHVAAERRKAAVVSGEFDDAFIAAHDAWTGIPRISISLERKQGLAQLVWEGSEVNDATLSLGGIYLLVGIDDKHVQHEERCYQESEDCLKWCRNH